MVNAACIVQGKWKQTDCQIGLREGRIVIEKEGSERHPSSFDSDGLLLANVYGLKFDSESTILDIFFIEQTQKTPYIKAKRHQLTIKGKDAVELGAMCHLINNTMENHLDSKKKILVIANPMSGDKRAMNLYEKIVKPMLEDANIPYDFIATEHQHHGHLVTNRIDFETYRSVLVIGGDGLLHEVVNGLLSRSNWKTTKDITIGLVSAGTSNAVARSLGISDPTFACYTVLRGQRHLFDAILFEQEGNRFYGHFAFFWGLIADIDLAGDECRCCGRCRLYWSTITTVLDLKTYHAVIEYIDAATECPEEEIQSDRPMPRYKHLFKSKDPIVKKLDEAAYHSFIATKHGWLDRDLIVSKTFHSASDIITILTIPKNPRISRGALLKAVCKGEIAHIHDDPELCWRGRVRACQVLIREYEGMKFDVDEVLLLQEAIRNLADEQTVLVHAPLGPPVTVQGLFKCIAEGIGFAEAWDIADVKNHLDKAGIRTLVLFLSKAQLMPAWVFRKMYTMLAEICNLCWIVDDVGFLTRLPLPLQMSLSHIAIESRDPFDITADLVSEVLSLKVVPSTDLILRIQECASQSRNPRHSLKNLLGLVVLEWRELEWTADSYMMFPSFKQAISDSMEEIDTLNKESVQKFGHSLICDAKIAVKRLSSVFKVFLLLRGLFGDEICTAKDLLSNLSGLKINQSMWLETLSRKIKVYDSEELVRRIQVLKKSLDGNCPFFKELNSMIDPISVDIAYTISEWATKMLPDKWDQIPLFEVLVLPLGRSTVKLTAPRICESLQLALDHPEFYFDGVISKEPSNQVPVTCLVHRLAMECGKLINTLDWFISFREIVDSRHKQSEGDLTLCFMRAVHELHLFGIVAPTKKRKDHYERLVLYHRRY